MQKVEVWIWNKIQLFGRTLVAGAIAFLILTGFSIFYYNIPMSYDCEDGSTDYKWASNVFYARGTEGFCWGKTNNEGYINSIDYRRGTPIDVLIIGSSQMEAFQVRQEESTTYLLNNLLNNWVVYNIGISGHTFPICVDNLDAAVQKYHPSKYIVIETSDICFPDDILNDVITDARVKVGTHSDGIIGHLKANPYIRLIWNQVQNYMETTRAETEISNYSNDAELLSALLKKIKKSADMSGAKAIVIYHPAIKLDSDGSILFDYNAIALEQFKRLCEKNGICFLDMSDRFKQEYSKSHILPYGFSNSSVGSGHLNKNGHAMIADELYQLMEG